MNRLLALQGLRALAAALVVFEHSLYNYAQKIDATLPVAHPVALGAYGVEIFFCISGLIILRSSRHLPAGPVSAGTFLWRRLARIVPMYWLATVLYAVRLHGTPEAAGLSDLLRSLLFIPYVDPATHLMRPVLGVGWTLNFEMFFYASMALALLLPARLRYWAVAAAFAALLLLWPDPAAHRVAGDPLAAPALLADPLLLYFLLGMGAGWLAGRAEVAALRLSWPVAMTVAALLLLVHLFVSPAAGLSGLPMQLAEHLAIVVAVFVCANTQPVARGDGAGAGAPGRVERWVVRAGDGSYSTYLTHGFVVGPCARALGLLHPQSTGLSAELVAMPFAAAMVVLCSVAGCVVYARLERPLTAWLNAPGARRGGADRTRTAGTRSHR